MAHACFSCRAWLIHWSATGKCCILEPHHACSRSASGARILYSVGIQPACRVRFDDVDGVGSLREYFVQN
eukprot:3483522-Prymnesium_polylepis.1